MTLVLVKLAVRPVMALLKPTTGAGQVTVTVVPEGSPVANYAFDVTPARLVTGLITERGILEASRDGLRRAFPERAAGAQEAAE